MDEPVEGVTLEQWATVAVALHEVPLEQHDEVAAARGIPAGRLQGIAQEWNRRMTEDPQVVLRYSAAYQQAMKDAGIEAPDISFEQYAEILKRQQTEEITAILPDYGLDLQTFALVSQRWIDAIAADTSLAVRLGEALGGQA